MLLPYSILTDVGPFLYCSYTLAIAWVLAQGEDIMTLVGSRTISQVKDPVKAINVHLSNEDLQRIEQIILKAGATSSYMLELNVDKNGLYQH